MKEEYKKHPVRDLTDLLCEMVIQLSETKTDLAETKTELAETKTELEHAETKGNMIYGAYMEYKREVDSKMTELEKEAAESRLVMAQINQFIDNHNNIPAERAEKRRTEA